MQFMSSLFLIYALHHPVSDHVYIGQSSTGMRRPREHSKAASLKRDARLPKSKWISSLLKRGLEPEIVVLEETTVELLDEAECFYIASFRAMGIPLLNLTDGGGGTRGYALSDEALANLIAERKQRAQNPKVRQQLADQSRAYWSNPAAREAKSAERKGKKKSRETRTKIAGSICGKKKTPEARANMRLAAKRRWESSEYREKQIVAQKAAVTDESRARSAETAKLASHETHRSPEYRAKQSALVKSVIQTKKDRGDLA